MPWNSFPPCFLAERRLFLEKYSDAKEDVNREKKGFKREDAKKIDQRAVIIRKIFTVTIFIIIVFHII